MDKKAQMFLLKKLSSQSSDLLTSKAMKGVVSKPEN